MKNILFYLITAILLIWVVNAEKTTEKIVKLDSIVLENQNITLISYNEKDDKVILCVNGVKSIAEKGNDKLINNVIVKIKDVRKEYVKLELESNCSNCQIEDNSPCINLCYVNSDCDDNNENTIDKCEGPPRKCVYTQVEKPIPENKLEEVKISNIDLKITKPQKKTFSQSVSDFFKNLFR